MFIIFHMAFRRQLGLVVLGLVFASGCTRPPSALKSEGKSTPPIAEGATIKGEVFIKTRGGQNVKLGLVEVKAIPATQFQPILESIQVRIHEEAKATYNVEVLGNAQFAMLDNKLRRLDLISKQLGLFENRFRAEMDAHDDVTNHAFRTAAENRHQRRVKIAEYTRALSVKLEELRGKASEIVSSHKNLPFKIVAEQIADTVRHVVTARTNSEGKFQLVLPSREPYILLAVDDRLVGDEKELYAWAVKVASDGSDPDNEIILSSHNEVAGADLANAIPPATFDETTAHELTPESKKAIDDLQELPCIPEELPRLAPKGEFYLSKYTSARVPNGIVGYPPGSPVKWQADQGSMKQVICDGHRISVEASALTNDLDRAELLMLDDSAQQSAIFYTNEVETELEALRNRVTLMRHAEDVEQFSRQMIENNAVGGHRTALDP